MVVVLQLVLVELLHHLIKELIGHWSALQTQGRSEGHVKAVGLTEVIGKVLCNGAAIETVVLAHRRRTDVVFVRSLRLN